MSSRYSSAEFPPYSLLDEPLLAFSPGDSRAKDLHPLRGLAKFGPFTKSVFSPFTPALRVATVGPANGWAYRGALMKTLQMSHDPTDRQEYVPRYPGFEQLFGIPLVAAASRAHVKWPDL